MATSRPGIVSIPGNRGVLRFESGAYTACTIEKPMVFGPLPKTSM